MACVHVCCGRVCCVRCGGGYCQLPFYEPKRVLFAMKRQTAIFFGMMILLLGAMNADGQEVQFKSSSEAATSEEMEQTPEFHRRVLR